ncbi:glutathione-independent formaldehyde dehydrogenase [Anaeromyxobacter diazotrophicus]|uniref:Alcohol dehydrogenase n=1 Tax=Anaeromyxobacter diazotrophicus TaxID=2590199 RepID=A0A7I9VRZ2_9BACT|nr:glutathione-independent formaldehyde dehydrogenase [Anaeromyxobacter diazotrophicus]GEJ59038.1 alcohol dehydrogenase [Anaeromyxobacter diazotrophicus]
MRAVVWKGPGKVSVDEVQDPRVERATDVVVRITTAGICGSDLHMYEGRTAAQPGVVMGHENMGVIEEVGSAVQQLRKGDRVVLPFNVSCGTCFNCTRGYTSACLVANDDAAGAAYGYVGMGPYKGGQAELLRVPWGEANCIKLPGTPGDELEDDFLLLSDIFPTGYHAAQMANVQPGSTVAVFGAGPVGLLAAYSAMLRGAAEVYVVDAIPERLKKAEQIGAIAVDFRKGPPAEQIRNLRLQNPLVRGAMRRGEEKMAGVMCGIDAVGYQAKDFADPSQEDHTSVTEQLAEVVNPTGALGIIGVFLPQDPGGKGQAAKHGEYQLPWGKLWEKGVQLGMGQTPVKHYSLVLRDLIIAGRAKPSFIVSRHIPLADAPDAYQKFDRREPGYTKVLIRPAEQVATPL